MINKYNIHWQIIRGNARKQKGAKAKVDFVMYWFRENATELNKARVKNWLIMSEMGFKDYASKRYYQKALIEIENMICSPVLDEDNNFQNIDDKNLMMVWKDLKKRKWNFQFNKAPSSHILFMGVLEMELSERKLIGV